MTDTGGEDMRVQLVRMEGKLDLANERHGNTERRLDNHEQRLHRHSNDIGILQARAHLQDGERKGITLAGGLGWKLATLFTGSGLIAALFKLFVS